ncbi:MAG: DUF3987 domain-containing protein [Gammaproteobacteria bacterium]|nr:DUF3987 domain-containing protein [Gammaproteobacteria bacterium]
MISTPHVVEFNWHEPIPLEHTYDDPLPYPIHCLPNVIQDAVTSYQTYGKQPLSLIACSALANVSLACQTLANIARDKILVSPTSLYFISVAPSGSRKSSIDSAFGQAMREWEKKTRAEREPDVRDARALHQAWLSEKEAILMQIRRTTLMGGDTSHLKTQFTSIMENEPVVPIMPSLFFEDSTPEAIASRLAFGWPSASIWSDEGGIILSGYGMQNNATKFVALLNRMWDGKDFVSHRKTSKSFTITHRRLTVSLMLQPLLMQQMISKDQGVVRQSGFMARSLITYPENAMGTRFYEEPSESLINLTAFHDRIISCLETSLSLDHKGCANIPVLSFSQQAKTEWVKQFNAMEAGLLLTDKWATITDFASKAAENTARLAALFHLFEGKDNHISCEDVERAVEIIQWHLFETKRILATPQTSAELQDAIKLLHWIINKGIKNTTPQYLQQYSPIREKKRRDLAIDTLLEHHYLRRLTSNGKLQLLINPKVIS